MDTLVSLNDVRKSYQGGEFSLHIDRLDVCAGQSLFITGPSGAGKTTLLNLLAALDRADQGVVSFFGEEMRKSSEDALALLRRKNLGFVFQVPRFIEAAPVWSNVSLRLVPEGCSVATRRARALAILEEVGIGELADRLPRQLSGGQRQRVALARALITDPQLLIADEPTSGVDHQTRDRIVKYLHEKRLRGGTLVVVSHDTSLARLGDKQFELVDGGIRSI